MIKISKGWRSSQVQMRLRPRPTDGANRAFKAAIGADRLRKPVDRRSRVCRSLWGRRGWRMITWKDIENNRGPRDCIRLGIRIGDARGSGSNVSTLRQIAGLDCAHHAPLKFARTILRIITEMEI